MKLINFVKFSIILFKNQLCDNGGLLLGLYLLVFRLNSLVKFLILLIEVCFLIL